MATKKVVKKKIKTVIKKKSMEEISLDKYQRLEQKLIDAKKIFREGDCEYCERYKQTGHSYWCDECPLNAQELIDGNSCNMKEHPWQKLTDSLDEDIYHAQWMVRLIEKDIYKQKEANKIPKCKSCGQELPKNKS